MKKIGQLTYEKRVKLQAYLDDVISPLIMDHRQIMVSHPEIQVTERTVRNWLDQGYTFARSHFLPRKVRYSTKKIIKNELLSQKLY